MRIYIAFLMVLMVALVLSQERKRASLPFDVSQEQAMDEAQSAVKESDAVRLGEALSALLEGKQDVFLRFGRRYFGVATAIRRLLNNAVSLRRNVMRLASPRLTSLYLTPELINKQLLMMIERGDIADALRFVHWAVENGYRKTPLMELLLAISGDRKPKGTLLIAGKERSVVDVVETLRRFVPKPTDHPPIPPPGRMVASVKLGLPSHGDVPLLLSAAVMPDRKTVFFSGTEAMALDSNGKVVWRKKVPEAVGNPALFCRRIAPTAFANSVILPLTDSLLALDGRDGSVVWHSTTIENSVMLTPPLVSGGHIYTLSLVRKRQDQLLLLCFDGDNGQLLWKRVVVNGFAPGGFGAGVYPRLALAEGRVSVLSGFEWLAVYEEGGEPVWARRYSLAGFALRARRVSLLRRRYPTILTNNGKIVIFPPDGDGITVYSLYGGERLWYRPTPEARTAAANRKFILILSQKSCSLLSLKNGAILAKFALPDEMVDVLADDLGFWILCKFWIVRVDENGCRRYFVPEAEDGMALAHWAGGLAVVGREGDIHLYGRFDECCRATVALREGKPNAAMNYPKAFLYLVRRMDKGKRYVYLMRAARRFPKAVRGGILIEAAVDALKGGAREAAVDALRRAVNVESEGACVEGLGWVVMPETALFMLSRLQDRDDEAAARDEVNRAVSAEARWRTFLRWPGTVAAQQAALMAARTWLQSGQNWRARKTVSLILALTKSKSVTDAAHKLINSTSSPPVKLFWRTLPCALNAEPPKLKILKTSPPLSVMFADDIVEVRDIRTGVVLWRLDLGADDLAVVGESTVAILKGNRLLFLRAKDGTLLRKHNLPQGKWLIAGGDRLYLVAKAGLVSVIRVYDERGKVIAGRKALARVVGIERNEGGVVVLSENGEVLFMGRQTTVVRTGLRPLKWCIGKGNLWLLGMDSENKKRLFLVESDGVRRRFNVDMEVGSMVTGGDWSLLLQRVPAVGPKVLLFFADGRRREYTIPRREGRLSFLKAAGRGSYAGVIWGTATDVRGFVLDVRGGQRVGFASLMGVVSGVAGPVVSGRWMIYAERSFWLVRMEAVDLRSGAVFGTQTRLRGRVWGVAGTDDTVVLWTREGMLAAFGCEEKARVEAGFAGATALLNEKLHGRYVAALEALGRREEAAKAGVALLDAGVDEQMLRAVTERNIFWNAIENPPRLKAYRVKRPPQIDGRPEDDCWLQSRAIVLRGHRFLFGVENPRFDGWRWLGCMDTSARVFIAWDSKNLYILVDLDDQVIYPMNQDEERYHNGDMLYLAIDRRGDGGLEANGDDILISLGLVAPRPRKKKGEGRKPKGVYMVRQKDDGTGVVYEMAIPWDYFRGEGVNKWVDIPRGGPKHGFVFGLNLVMVDDDTGMGASKVLSLAPGLILGRHDRYMLWRGYVPDGFARVVLEKSR